MQVGNYTRIALIVVALGFVLGAAVLPCLAGPPSGLEVIPDNIRTPVIFANEPAAATLSGMGLAGLWYYGRSRSRRRFRSELVAGAMASGLVIVEPRASTFLSWLQENAYLFAKRASDILISGLALIVLSPFLTLLAIVLYIDSPGPIFYRQERLGLGRRKFKLLKFRSMCVNADKVLQENEELKREFEELYKLKNDPRITRVGKILRKTSLDELPQLVNVLLGDIALVGPRPIVEAEVEKYWPFEERLFSVKPGVTGLWQVSGRNDTSYEERVRLDMRYIAERSLVRDASILIRTVPALLGKGTGAY